MRRICLVLGGLFAAVILLVASPLQAGDAGWQAFHEDRLGYRIDLPLGMFHVVEEMPDRISLQETGGEAQLLAYGGENAGDATVAEFRRTLEGAEWIREITYRAGGRSWFVLSGYYRREDVEQEDLIFYAKVMFNADRSRFSGFEISYPRSDKRRFDPIVTRIEKSLRPPA